MRQFREAMRLALAARLEWRRRRPKAVNLKRNAFLLQMCIGGATKTEQLRINIVSVLFNGCWERADAVEHDCVGPGCCASREDCLQKMVTIGVASLAAAGPPKFPRHRWTGIVEAIAWPLLLESLHGLLAVVYKLYCAQLRGGRQLQKNLLKEMARLGKRSDLDGQVRPATEEVGLGVEVDAARGQSTIDAPLAAAANDDHTGGPDLDSIEVRRLQQSLDPARALGWISHDP